jgi:L-fuconolactonase
VACKLSGMVTEANPQAWQATDFTPFLDVVLDTFGPDRLMIGSDWPVCRQAAEYDVTLDIVRAAIAPLSSDEQDAILGGTATRWYGLRPDA